MNTVSLQIKMPTEIFQAIEKNHVGKNIEEFVLDAIKSKIKHKNDSIDELLKEGYIATRDENLSISSDFHYVDLENWD